MKQFNRIRIYYNGLDLYSEIDTTMSAAEVAKIFEARSTLRQRFRNWLQGVDPANEFVKIFSEESNPSTPFRETLEIYARMNSVRSIIQVAVPIANRKTS